jgi:hypothetical protein
MIRRVTVMRSMETTAATINRLQLREKLID